MGYEFYLSAKQPITFHAITREHHGDDHSVAQGIRIGLFETIAGSYKKGLIDTTVFTTR
jgi:hypothetical protein